MTPWLPARLPPCHPPSHPQAAKAKEIADDAQRDLDEALPALDAAVASLKLLSRNDIVEVKAMQNPPAGVETVMEAACIMIDEKPKMKDDPNKVGGRGLWCGPKTGLDLRRVFYERTRCEALCYM